MKPDFIHLKDLPISCIIGILPKERRTKQPLQVQVSLEMDLGGAGITGDLSRTVNYAALAKDIIFILEKGKFRLLETAALAICHYLLYPKFLMIEAVRVEITKPKALAGVGIPSVVMERRRAELHFARNTPIIFAAEDVAIQWDKAQPVSRKKSSIPRGLMTLAPQSLGRLCVTPTPG